MVGRVGVNPGVERPLLHQSPARPPIPKRSPPFVSFGNTPLRSGTLTAIKALAQNKPPMETITAPAPRLPSKRCRESTKPQMGYREKQRAVRSRNDELGKLIAEQTKLFLDNDWERYVEGLRGRGDLAPVGEGAQTHPAGNLLRHLASQGAPAIMSTPPWKPALLEQRFKRGSHKSCNDNLDFLRAELLDFVKKGFWTVLPYRLLKEKYRQKMRYLRDMRLSPMGVVPQRERRPRIIVDYSFYEVNQETLSLGPSEAMQFGRALERVLYQVRHANPRYGPVYIGKVDLADGFYRVWLSAGAIPKLSVALPVFSGEEPMVAMPLTLPMGWKDSVPYFCSATETVADIANSMPTNAHLDPHPLEQVANTPPPAETDPSVPTTTAKEASTTNRPLVSMPPVLRPYHKPTMFTDIFIDDYILGIQGKPRERLQHLRRLLHAIDQVFRPVDKKDAATRNHVPSVKKFLKGDAYLST